MIRRAFLKRMAFAAMACAFLDMQKWSLLPADRAEEMSQMIQQIFVDRVVPHVRTMSPVFETIPSHEHTPPELVFPVSIQ